MFSGNEGRWIGFEVGLKTIAKGRKTADLGFYW